MRIDVVIVTFESADYLPRCLDSLPEWCDITVVDNASSDRSAAIAVEHQVTVISNDTNRGFAAAVNQGVETGTNEFVLLLNPDASIDEVNLARLVRRMANDDDLAVLSPRLQYDTGSPQRTAWPFPNAADSWAEALGLLRLIDRRPPGFVIGACFLARRSIWDQLGGFDERYWLYGEESDYCKRALDAGYRVELDESSSALHAGGASGPALGATTFEHFHRGTDHFISKHYGPNALRSHRAAVLIGSLLRAPVLSVARPSDPRTAYRWRLIRRQLRVLAQHPTVVHLDGPPIVICSLEDWDDVWRRNQFIVSELSELHPDRRFLWVEPPYDALHRMRTGSGSRRRRGLRPVPDYPRVVRFQPTKLAPRRLGGWVDRSLQRQATRRARRLAMRRPTLWINDVTYAPLAASTRWPSVYDITDDWLLAVDGGDRDRLSRLETEALIGCDEVVVCSNALQASKVSRGPRSLIPNAADTQLMARPQPRPIDLPSGLCAVYVGTLHEHRLDVALAVRIAQECPDVAFVYVGPNALSDENTARLTSPSNVTVLGARTYREVPAYLQHADVLIVPHVVTEFTESLDPIKAYEYLAAGRPVVSTAVAGFRDLVPAVRVAPVDSFSRAVKEAIGSGPPSTTVTVPSWRDRALDFQHVLERVDRKPLRVVYLGHTAKLSGGELALSRLLPALPDIEKIVLLGEDGPLVERLTAAGATVEVLAMSEASRNTRKDSVSIRTVPVRSAWDAARYAMAVARRLRWLKPDLVHTNTLKAAVYGGVAGRIAHVPVVWHIRDRIANDYLPPQAVRLVRALGRVLPTAIICNSDATLNTMQGLGRPLTVAPSPVVFDSVSQSIHCTRVSNDDVVFAMVGRLAPWKGQELFLRAFATAFPAGLERAVIIGSAMFGEDEYAQNLELLSHELGLTDRVEFRGFKEDVFAELERADVLVHASLTPEPFGQVIIEGMAAGLPVIAARGGGPAEIVSDGVNGLLFSPGDVRDLADTLRRVAGEPTLRDSLASAGRERAKQFTPDLVATAIRATYHSALGR